MKLISIFILLACIAEAQSFYPLNSTYDKPDPIASPDAIPGGKVVEYIGPSPKSLNAYLDNNTMSNQIFGMLYESLIGFDSNTLEYERAIAEKWTISDDKLTFTFYLDKNARWSDGKPITAEDVVWTYNAIVNPNNSYYGGKLVSIGRPGKMM